MSETLSIDPSVVLSLLVTDPFIVYLKVTSSFTSLNVTRTSTSCLVIAQTGTAKLGFLKK